MLNPMPATQENMMNETPMQEGKIKPKTAAQEVLEFAQVVCDLAEKVRIQAAEKLSLVALPLIKEDEKRLGEIINKPFPPLFEDLWCKLNNIRHNLILICDLLSRTEL